MGLDAVEDDQVALRCLVVIEVVLGPDDLAISTFGVADHRPKLGEVVELLGIDLSKLVGVPAVDQILGGGGRGRTGVGPAGESGDKRGFAQLGLFEDLQWGHAGGLLSLRYWATNPIPGSR